MTTRFAKVTWDGKSKISWKMLSDMELPKQPLQSYVKLAKSLQILNVGLAASDFALSAAILRKVNVIDNKINKINAKFDLMFLDKAIDYVVSSWNESEGISREILAVLENDLLNALSAIETERDLYAPAYLSHKIYRLASSICETNQFFYMMLHGGNISESTEIDIKEWVLKNGATIGLLPTASFSEQISILNVFDSVYEKKDSSLMEKFKLGTKTQAEILQRTLADKELLKRAFPLVLLLRETRVLSDLFQKSVDCLSKTQGEKYLKIA